MSDTSNKDYDNLISKGLISELSQKDYLKRLKKLDDENKRLEESSKRRKHSNEKFIASLPKGFTFMVGNFEITV